MPSNSILETHPRAAKALMDRIWALHPAKLEQVAELTEQLLAGGRTADFDAAASRQRDYADRTSYDVVDGVAVIDVTDVLDRRMNFFMRFSGGTSTQILEKQIERASADGDVDAILLNIDSPGGSVFGPEGVARAVEDAGKPVIAYVDAMAASAAYWIASAAVHVIAMPNAEVGSIGVVAMHIDYSKADDEQGVKRTYVTAGKYKRIAADNEPLSKDGRAYLQNMVDDYYRLFVEAVAAGRGMEPEAVAATEARTYVADKALEAGLIDSIGNFNDALALAREKGGSIMPSKQANADAPAPEAGAEQVALTVEAVESDHAEIHEAIMDKGRAEGAGAERERILGILDLDGDAAATREAIEAGDSVEAAGMRFFKAERDKRGKALEELERAAPESPGSEEPEGPAPQEKASDELARKAAELAKAENMDTAAAQQRVLAEDPELNKRYKAQYAR
jgi:signal peptide peptidase SppA